ncbi:hypothetical protein [Nocardia blacklockiae]|uniref:hypothetical protein n=1 Tax=Nocardia blacklockiae TaxID=480036 RepID=UPI0018953F41|nr:hypothetical protein [Nocardia blacklockiae]MBF6171818.1 hypothetical protein [Nocardia blacklockiae]
MTSGTSPFLDALAEFERAVRGDDVRATRAAHEALARALDPVTPAELAQAGPRLAAVLDAVPLGGQANVAVLIAVCVDHGADAAACGPPVLTHLIVNLGYAVGFARAWLDRVGGALPDPDGDLPPELLDVDAVEVVLSWWALDGWVRAGSALLRHPEIGQRLDQETRDQLAALHTELTELTGRRYEELAEALGAATPPAS